MLEHALAGFLRSLGYDRISPARSQPTEIDSTLVGGPPEVIDALITAPRLDSWRIEPQDSLAADGDGINH